MSQPTVQDLYNRFKTHLNNYILLAFEQNRYLRLRYQQLANAILNALIANVESKQASQRVIHKDVSVFVDYIDYAERTPPLPSINYAGPTTTIAGKQVPELPVFQFTPPVVELETASLTVLANTLIIQIDRSINADADYENAFAKYFTFQRISVAPSQATIQVGMSINDAPLTMAGRLIISPTSNFIASQRIFLTRTIVDKTTNQELLTINANLYAGQLQAALDTPDIASPQPIDLPAFLITFEAIGAISYFIGLRIMSTNCTGSVTDNHVIGKILILRKSGFAGSIYCG